MGKIEALAHKMSIFLDRLAQFTLMILMMLVVINIVLRVAFGSPILGTYEITGFLFAIVISLSIAYCSLLGGHIKVEFLAERFPESVQIAADVLLKIVAIVFFAIATWTLWEYGLYLKTVGEVSPSAKIAFYYFVYVIVAGFVMLCINLVVELLTFVRNVSQKQEQG